MEQSTAILDIVQSGHGLTSFYGYYLSQNFQLLTMRRCIATGCKNDPKTWKLLPYLWNGHKFFKLGPLNWATCLLFLFWNCKIQVWGIKNKVLNLLPKLATPRYSGFTSNTLNFVKHDFDGLTQGFWKKVERLWNSDISPRDLCQDREQKYSLYL